MKRIAIIAALPGELGPLVAGWERAYPWKSQPSRARAVFRHCRLWQRRRGDTELIAVCAGAGLRAARHAFTAAELLGPLDAAISVGWAGALQAGFQAGRAYHVSGLIDAQTGEVFHTAGEAGQAWLATSHQVAGHAQKQQLAQTYHAELVDMEGVAIARLTAAHNIPFYCVKGVSDALADRLPDFNRFIGRNGQFHFVRFVLFAALRPWWWGPLRRLGRQSKAAADGIQMRVREVLHELK